MFSFFWTLNKVIPAKNQYTNKKWYHGKMFSLIGTYHFDFIKPKEFTDHPITIRTDPESDGEIMRQLGFDLFCTMGNINSYGKCRDNHDDAKFTPDHAPAYIFKKPKDNM